MDEDRPLLDRVATGDQQAFAALYARHGRALLAYAEGLLADRGRAEEAVQDTLLALWRGAAGFEGRSTVRTWLFGICRRQALRRLPVSRPSPLPVEAAADLPDGGPGPEAVVLARADAGAVAAALAGLAPAHREVLDLAFGAGLSHAEIAEVLGVPVGTVKSRLFHARASLARALSADDAGTPDRSSTPGARGSAPPPGTPRPSAGAPAARTARRRVGVEAGGRGG